MERKLLWRSARLSKLELQCNVKPGRLPWWLQLFVVGSGLLGWSVGGLPCVRLRALLSFWTCCRMDSVMRPRRYDMRSELGENCARSAIETRHTP